MANQHISSVELGYKRFLSRTNGRPSVTLTKEVTDRKILLKRYTILISDRINNIAHKK